MSTDWVPVLDLFEERLAQRWSAFEAGTADAVPDFTPPQMSTPLPQHLQARAVDLVRRCRALEDALAATLARVGEQLVELAETKAAPPRTGPAQPAYFDSKV